ncbi:MAG: hypothetical protein NXI21_19355 [Alphaproteobacteria bacterium]|nr:hypothetical protein [Alphaproteobacteria bacterium]
MRRRRRPLLAAFAACAAALVLGAGVASAPAAAAPGCYERSAARVEAGVVDDGVDYFAARHFANPTCGAYDPERAEALYRRALIHAGGRSIAAGYWALLRREPALARRPGAPSAALLFRIAAVGSLSAGTPAKIRAAFAGTFHGAAPPEAFLVLEETLAASQEARLSRLVADAREEPLLRGAALSRCISPKDQVSAGTLFSCFLHQEEMARGSLYPHIRDWARDASEMLLYLLANRGHSDALVHGARLLLARGDVRSLEQAYRWLLWADAEHPGAAEVRAALESRIPDSRRALLRFDMEHGGFLTPISLD